MKKHCASILAATIIGFLAVAGCDTIEMSRDETVETSNSSNGSEEVRADTPEEKEPSAAPVGKPVDPGKGEKEFIPAGWKQEDRVTGDLNGDSRPDIVLQIVNEKASTEFNRRMIVLLQNEDGKYTLGGDGRKVIRCTECHGTFGPGPAEIKIEKGVIIVSQIYGSRWATDYLHRFRYEKDTGRFRLIGEDVNNFDRGAGEAEITSTNYLTGKQIITKEKVGESGEYEEVSRNEKRVPTSKKYLEDINYDDY